MFPVWYFSEVLNNATVIKIRALSYFYQTCQIHFLAEIALNYALIKSWNAAVMPTEVAMLSGDKVRYRVAIDKGYCVLDKNRPEPTK